MKIKEFLGSTVLDKNAYEVGRVGDIDFDPETGAIGTITLTLQKNMKLLKLLLKLKTTTNKQKGNFYGF